MEFLSLRVNAPKRTAKPICKALKVNMGRHQNSLAKRERERRKKSKAAEKREKRQKRQEQANDANIPPPPALPGDVQTSTPGKLDDAHE
jgi:hypothetical protein